MKRIEIKTAWPSKSQWEFAVVPIINLGYVNKCYFVAVAWLLWHIIIIIKKK